MNRITALSLAGVLAASVAILGCHNDDHETHHHHHDTGAPTTNTVAANSVTDTAGGAAQTTGDATANAAHATGDVASGAAGTTGKTAAGAADTTGKAVAGAADTTGKTAAGAADTTGKVAVGAAKTSGEAATDVAKGTGEVVVGAAKTTGDAAADIAHKTGDAAAGAAKTTADATKTGAGEVGAAVTAADKDESKSAYAEVMASKAPGDDDVKGVVHFWQKGDMVHVHAKITGLKPDSEHGFHIHEKADLSAPDLKSAGGHFNPTHMKHGGPTGDARHGGDLGNLKADDKGVADYEVDVAGISIDGKTDGIVGRSIIIHADADDLKTDPSGKSGDRIAGGVIMEGKAPGAKKAPAGEKDASNDAKKDEEKAK